MNGTTRRGLEMNWSIIIVASSILMTTACSSFSASTSTPTPRLLPTTVPELAALVAGESAEGPPPIDAIRALGDIGPAAAPAVPAIISALEYYEDHGSTISAAAQALGKIGAPAAPAVPELVTVILTLNQGTSMETQLALTDAVVALGRIGPQAAPAVPTLAQQLHSSNEGVALYAAWSIAQIARNEWPDAERQVIYMSGIPSLGGSASVEKNRDGEYLIVIAAREWWTSEGKHREWPAISDE
jgi:HEAT repeat protein